MAKIRGSVALTLTFVNIMGTIGLLVLIVPAIDNARYRTLRELTQIEKPNPNLRGTKLKFIKMKSEIEDKISKNKKYYDPSYYTEDEFIIEEKQASEESSKKLRQLLSKNDFMLYALYVDLAAFLFTFILMFSFCVDKNECCDKDSQDELGLGCCICCLCCDDCHCNCDCKNSGGGDSGSGLLICLIIILVFVLLYFAVKACGKHISRYIAITAELLLFITISIFAFIYGFDVEPTSWVCIASGVLALANFLGLLLPNLGCCIYLTYGYKANLSVMNDPLVQNQPTSGVPYQGTANIAPQPLTPVYAAPVAQGPPSYPQNNPMHPPQNPPPLNNGYNSGQGGIYSASPMDLPPNNQPQSIYQAQPSPK